ncbi:MAG TPA: asparagine synthase (glutamine-hydrolyzing) [Pirellulales bacterium]|jgi:asparagine synthase (glutamine-hydrolysing)|nr:asparagine synthase (glutamine-hydrolyzing) [Pirellulales bacterium]
MCGVAGILTRRGDMDLPATARCMLGTLRHRGPEDEGIAYLDLAGGWRLTLVHTRLSILDLSSAGHQPMGDAASGSWIVYNGEVYNHAAVRARLGDTEFHSLCDTETVLAGWVAHGPQILDELRGMFAMAIYDGRRQGLYLVRDRLGIKPLYVCRCDANTWVFASEIRTLLACQLIERKLNPQAIDSYLSFGAVPAPWTIVAGVQSLMPGEYWHFDLGKDPSSPRRVSYWRPPFEQQNHRGLRYAEAVEMIRPVLTESVALHTVSDVPVGVFLSGGIDSSGVVAALASQGRVPRTFSILFGEREYDERIHARHIASHFGTEHVELELAPQKILSAIGEAVAAYDQPSIDGINTYFISQAVREAGVKVAMSGLGGDELFAGYGSFRVAAWLDRTLYRFLARLARPLLKQAAPGAMRTEKLAAIVQSRPSRLTTYAILRQVMMRGRLQAIHPSDTDDVGPPLPAEVVGDLKTRIAGIDPLNAYSLLELSLYLGNMLLRDTDQMSMAHSIEVRVPLLDHVLVETLARIPGPLKLGRFRTKPLLIDALPSPLPKEVFRRPKMGFVFPWELWLRNELRNVVSCVFSDTETFAALGIDHEAAKQLWQGFCQFRPGIRYTDILSLLHLLSWARTNKMSL